MSEASDLPDISSILADIQQRYGWRQQDMKMAMQQLLGAAQSGVQNFGSVSAAKASSASADMSVSPVDLMKLAQQNGLASFFGSPSIQHAVAEQIGKSTGLQKQAVAELMPVVVTVLIGNALRPSLHGEAREWLDSFMRGYVRGRPKPAPTAQDYIESYTKSVHAFWSGFMVPKSGQNTKTAADNRSAREAKTGCSMDCEQAEDWFSLLQKTHSEQAKLFDVFYANLLKSSDKDE